MIRVQLQNLMVDDSVTWQSQGLPCQLPHAVQELQEDGCTLQVAVIAVPMSVTLCKLVPSRNQKG
jgi:hypothetical protein